MTHDAGATTPESTQQRLDRLITRLAVALMPVNASTLDESLSWAIAELGRSLDVDTAFLRRHDHEAGVSILTAEWPGRPVVEPDPLGVVAFSADPVFAASQHLREPMIVEAGAVPDYEERVEQASGVAQVSMATVPLVHDGTTEGVLGFVNFGPRTWSEAEINALQAIASLLVQLQARIAAEERLHYLAYHDELTGLASRRGLLVELERRLGDPSGGPVAVLFVDVDQLKVLNDALGHRTGDKLLASLAARLARLTRRGELVARIAGDEFVVVLPEGTTEPGAVAAAERLLSALGDQCEVEGALLTRTCSIGVALGRPGSHSAEQLLTDGDVAMYLAKSRGRNQVALYDDQVRRAVEQRFETEQQLRRAVQEGQFRLHYQPELDLVTGELVAVEALLRWDHPSRGQLAAGSFIDVAEESGLIVQIGPWVLDEAARQLARWTAAYPDDELVVRVNVSPAQLIGDQLVDQVVRVLERHRIPAHRLCLEITEHAVVQDLERGVQVLRALRRLGVGVAIDDFGTGHSSLALLKQVPADTLKIDNGFVAGLGRDPRDEAVVAAAIGLAASFGMAVVAEGVESAEHVSQLLRLGCRRAQGYHLGRPAPPGAVDALLLRARAGRT
jgi:diguanylate cyclase (GGDEF)-like protein